MDINDVKHPKHYTNHPSRIEVINVTRLLPGDLSNMFKYCVRFRDKNKPYEDLEKAITYTEDQIDHIGMLCTESAMMSNAIPLIEKFMLYEESLYLRNVFFDLLKLIELKPFDYFFGKDLLLDIKKNIKSEQEKYISS
jgi:hypothetical protein